MSQPVSQVRTVLNQSTFQCKSFQTEKPHEYLDVSSKIWKVAKSTLSVIGITVQSLFDRVRYWTTTSDGKGVSEPMLVDYRSSGTITLTEERALHFTDHTQSCEQPHQIFRSEEELHRYLSSLKRIETWEIEDKRLDLRSNTYFLHRENSNFEMQRYESNPALLRVLSKENGRLWKIIRLNISKHLRRIEYVIDRSGWFTTKFEVFTSKDAFLREYSRWEENCVRMKRLWVIASLLIGAIASIVAIDNVEEGTHLAVRASVWAISTTPSLLSILFLGYSPRLLGVNSIVLASLPPAFCIRTADLSRALDLFDKADNFERKGDLQRAAALYRQGAELGHKLSQHYLANAYEHGRGIPQDYGQAVVWYKKAADQGWDPSFRGLGRLCQHGRGMPHDLKTAVKFFDQADAIHTSENVWNSNWVYYKIPGVPSDDEEAQDFYEKAVALGQSAKEGTAVADYFIREIYKKSGGASREASLAQAALGYYYEKGLSLPQDQMESARWRQKAQEKRQKEL